MKFTRQHSIDNYIVDFYCGEKKLVIELEGAQHLTVDGKRADLDRDTYLRSLGYVVLRFPNNLVDRNAEEVLQAIITQAGQ